MAVEVVSRGPITFDQCWLGTQRLPEATVHASGALAQTIKAELRQTRRIRNDLEVALCILSRLRESPLWPEAEAALPADGLGDEGFVVVRRGNQLLVAAEAGRGLLYGYFYLLRYFEWMTADFTVVERPAVPIRMLDHWDDLTGSVERGYSGGSIFFRDGRVVTDLARVRAYARLLASVGINAVAFKLTDRAVGSGPAGGRCSASTGSPSACRSSSLPIRRISGWCGGGWPRSVVRTTPYPIWAGSW